MVVVVALGTAAGCHRTFKGSAVQPNPLRQPLETLRVSEPITIVTRDMELVRPRPAGAGSMAALIHNEPYNLENRASFTVVSRDRLRFHVQLEHKWKDYADVGGWQAWIMDSRGRRYLPEEIEARKPDLVVFMWDVEVRSVSRNAFGDITSVADDGYKNRQPLGSMSLFRGRGDYVFHGRDIFTPDLRWITLIVERPGMAFTFTWKFDDSAGTSDPRQVVTR
ncbi:MAG TPA: hypothetical protein VL172_22575 [Kofleriaceae bacterium]|nr:hypothetical protein [Kofleriaceae bacterium]